MCQACLKCNNGYTSYSELLGSSQYVEFFFKPSQTNGGLSKPTATPTPKTQPTTKKTKTQHHGPLPPAALQLSCACPRHVANMSPTHDNVGKNSADRTMSRHRHNFLPGPSHAFLCWEMPTFHRYAKVINYLQ
jgi:hypothetical protein